MFAEVSILIHFLLSIESVQFEDQLIFFGFVFRDVQTDGFRGSREKKQLISNLNLVQSGKILVQECRGPEHTKL